jgi:hypothetical protein
MMSSLNIASTAKLHKKRVEMLHTKRQRQRGKGLLLLPPTYRSSQRYPAIASQTVASLTMIRYAIAPPLVPQRRAVNTSLSCNENGSLRIARVTPFARDCGWKDLYVSSVSIVSRGIVSHDNGSRYKIVSHGELPNAIVPCRSQRTLQYGMSVEGVEQSASCPN